MTTADIEQKRSRHFRRVMFCAWGAGAWASTLVPRRVVAQKMAADTTAMPGMIT